MAKKMKPEYEPKTEQQIVGYLIEECGELQAALGKTLRWGWHSANPELPRHKQTTNLSWVEEELRDVERGIRMLREHLGIVG